MRNAFKQKVYQHFWHGVAVAIVMGFMVVCVGYWLLDVEYPWIDNFSDFMLGIIASVIGVVGVSVTGYIFLIESIRGLGDRDPFKKSVADEVRSTLFGYLKAMLIISILEIIACIMSIDRHDGMTDNFSLFLVFLFVLILIASIWLDLQMMNFNRSLTRNATVTLDRLKREFDRKPLVIRIDSEEYNELVLSKKNGGREVFEEDHDVLFKDGEVYEGSITDHSRFLYVHGYDDNILFKRNERAYRYFLARHSVIADRIFGDMQEIVPWSIIGYCDIHDEFDTYDVLHVFENTERILCRVVDSDGSSLETSDHNDLSTTLSNGKSFRVEAGMVDDIVSRYFEIKEYRDNYMVRFEDEFNDVIPSKKDFPDAPLVYIDSKECVGLINYGKTWAEDVSDDTSTGIGRFEYLKAISPFVYLLRYELTKKLSKKNISGLSLYEYDFSYGEMEGVICHDSNLMDTLFYDTTLRYADFTGSDLSNSRIRFCVCTGIVFASAKMSGVEFEKSLLAGAIFNDATVSSVLFPQLNLHGSSFNGATVIGTRFENCRLTNTSMAGAKIISSAVNDCLMSNSALTSLAVSESHIRDCDFNGSLMGGCTISTSTLRNCALHRVLISDSAFSSDVLTKCDFDNSECEKVVFSGTQMINVSFQSAILNGSSFNRVYIGPMGLDPKNNDWSRSDRALCTEYSNVRQRLESLKMKREGKESRDEHVSEAFEALKQSVDLQTEVDACVSNMANAQAEGCIFNDSEITSTNMYGVILSGSSFINTKITWCTMENASLSRCQFTDVKMVEGNLTNVSFDDALIANSVFVKTHICNASMSGCSLTQSTFNGCDFRYTALNNSFIVNCTMINVSNVSPSIMNSTVSNLKLIGCVIGGIRFDHFVAVNTDALRKEFERLGGRITGTASAKGGVSDE